MSNFSGPASSHGRERDREREKESERHKEKSVHAMVDAVVGVKRTEERVTIET